MLFIHLLINCILLNVKYQFDTKYLNNNNHIRLTSSMLKIQHKNFNKNRF